MYIQLNTGLILMELPSVHWVTPAQSISLDVGNAEQLGYVPVQKYYTQQVQAHLDAQAVARGYDNILSACSYAAVPNAFQAESMAFIAWRSAVWAYLHQGFADMLAGMRALPTPETLLAELPTLASFEVAE